MCPEYVIFKGLDAIIDKELCNVGFKLNVRRAPFYHKTQLKSQEIVSDNVIKKRIMHRSRNIIKTKFKN